MEIDAKGRILELLSAYLENEKYFIVDLNISKSKKSPIVLLLLDTDNGISIDECALISRKLGNDIEAGNIFETPFVLEVSSPGVDTPLVEKRHYAKNIGRSLKVSLQDGEKMIGNLESVSDIGVTIFEEKLKGRLKSVKKEPTFLSFDNIKVAQVQISFG
jgi:ribosome maturation factor RimP